MILSDLEALLGVVSQSGDCTKLVYDLLKDTKNKKSLLAYRRLCSDKDLERRLGELANRHEVRNNASKDDNRRPSYAEWVAGQRGSLPL